jgi:hypothetical protein
MTQIFRAIGTLAYPPLFPFAPLNNGADQVRLLAMPLPPIRQRLHPSTSRYTAASCLAPLLLWCGCLLSALAVCHVTSCHATAPPPTASPPLIALLPLIAPLS